MNVVDIAEHVSKFIWDWMKVTDTIPHAAVREVGATSYLLYSLYHSDEYGKSIGKLFTFESTGKHERITGADFYLVVYTGSRVGKYLVQAKRMKSAKKQDILQNKYYDFSYKSNSRADFQFNVLRAYCALNSFEALYCFYNSRFNQPFSLKPKHKTLLNLKCVDRKYSDTNQDVLGVTLSWAEEIYNEYFLGGCGAVRNISFEESLLLRSTVSLQEFFREAYGSENPEGPEDSEDSKDPEDAKDTGIVDNYENHGDVRGDNSTTFNMGNYNTPTAEDLNKESKCIYENLEQGAKEIIEDILNKNIEYLPIFLCTVDGKGEKYGEIYCQGDNPCKGYGNKHIY